MLFTVVHGHTYLIAMKGHQWNSAGVVDMGAASQSGRRQRQGRR
jgi:hypothetical protein